MKTFIKLTDVPVKARLLYVMGATWHNQCMFDLKTSEPNFSDLLNSKGIETYTFDIAGTGPDKKTETIGDGHRANIDHAIGLIEQYKIEYVLGYSYGALLVNDMIGRLPDCVKGVILLDPYAVLKQDAVIFLDGGDKKLVKRSQVAEDLVTYNCKISDEIRDAYLKNLTNDAEDLVTASYPGKQLKASFERFSSPENIKRLCNRKFIAFFTSTSNKLVRERFPEAVRVMWPDTSHWILLEQKRYDLANAISDFIGS